MVEHKLGGVPHFCVTIRHDENREKVQIPVEFLDFMPKCLSGSAVLRGLSNGHWTVKLSLEAYCLFITEGWDRFFEENALRKNDFLVFGYCGGGETEKFDVRIFDKHGRERLDVPDAVGLSATNQEIKKEDTNVAFGRKEKGCKYSENNTLSGLQGENLSIGLKPETSCKRKRDGPAECGVATMSLDRNDTTEVAMSAWSKSLAFSSSNPFFKCILTKQHLQKYHLSIPREMTYPGLLPNEKTMIVLRNLKDEVWVVGVAPNAGGHSFIYGWHKFANENNLMEGNVCIFELVTRNDLLVHVFN